MVSITDQVDYTEPINNVRKLPTKMQQEDLQQQKSLKQKKHKRVLMVEDDLDTSKLIANRLRDKYSCLIDVAHDPFEAMNLMSDNFYDLIILDWQLPELNGGETLVRAEKSFNLEPTLPVQWEQQKVPVVLFSSSKVSHCRSSRTEHFSYVGYISKTQSLNKIIDSFGEYLNEDTPFQYGSA